MGDTRTRIRAMDGGRSGSDRIWTWAIVVSVAVHLGAISLIARSFASRLANHTVAAAPRHINVDLIDLPENHPPKPKPIPQPHLTPEPARPVVPTTPPPSHEAVPTPPVPGPRPAVPRPGPAPVPMTHSPSAVVHPAPQVRAPGNPGGRLNIGAVSPNGEVGGNWTGGHTPTGWVPGHGDGPGKGSGSGVGVGAPDPPKHADDGPGTRPAPAPVVPPPPPTVRVKVCVASGDLPGEHCQETRTESFVEGKQPTRRCTRCKPPQPTQASIWADRKEPEIIKDPLPSIPSSVDEGLSVVVRVEYTVTTDGDVSDVRITKSSGLKAIDRAVLDAARRLKYKPAVQDGVPRAVKRTRDYRINT